MKLMTFSIALAAVLAMGSASAAPLRISVLGDSYSTFEGFIPRANAVWYSRPPRNLNDVTDVKETWWHLAAEKLGGVIEVNNSWSGATVSFTGYPDRTTGKPMDFTVQSFVTRASALGDPDVIFVCGGTNDSWCDAPIGEYQWGGWTRKDLFSFRPAMAKMCRELRTLYPSAQVIFLLNNGLKGAINESVHVICARYGIKCVDLQNIDKQRSHPSVAGMKAIAEQAAAAVEARGAKPAHPVDFTGWRELFARDLSNAEPMKESVWSFDAEGNLNATKDVNLVTRDEYADFALDFEFRLEPGANAGVFLYASDLKNWIPNKLEIQLLDDAHPSAAKYPAIWKNGAMYGHQAPTKNTLKPAGEWNRMTIYAEGKRIRVAQNGEFILEADLDDFTDAKKNPDGSDAPKWHTKPYCQLKTAGRIGLQGCHGGVKTQFRNIRVKR